MAGLTLSFRTATLSKIWSWHALGPDLTCRSYIFVTLTLSGNCIPLVLGGSITTTTGNPLVVFYIAAAIFTFISIYVVSVLPETFPEDERNTVSCMHSEPSVNGVPKTTRLSSILLVFQPLKMLVPTRSLGKNHNWRLTWFAVHSFVFVTAHHNSSSAWFVLMTSKFHLTPADVSIDINWSRCKLNFFNIEWDFLHRCYWQQHVGLGSHCSSTYSLFASILQPTSRVLSSLRRRFQ